MQYHDNDGEVIEIKRNSERKNSISCCMITRDEEDFIVDAVESVRNLADEVVIIDTGSSDRTVELARECGARVYRKDWDNSFSNARNESISRAGMEWILILDADEYVSEESCNIIREMIEKDPECSFKLEQRTYCEDSAFIGWKKVSADARYNRGQPGYFSTSQIRLFRNDSRVRYRGEVHENVEQSLKDAGIRILTGEAVIHHYGRMMNSERVYRKYQMYRSPGEKKLEFNSDNIHYIFEMAVQLLALEHTEEALRHVEKGLELDPDNWQLLNMGGLACTRLGELNRATGYLRRAVELNDRNPDLYNNLGVALIEKNMFRRAMEILREGIELDSENVNLLRNAASVSLAAGKPDEACEYIKRSLKGDPYSSHSHVINAEAMIRKRDYGCAEESLEKIRFLPGTPLKVYVKAIQLYIRMNKTDEAERILDRAGKDYPENNALQFLSGKLWELKGNDDKAISAYRKLLSSEPGNPEVINSIGCAYERKGNFKKALGSFRDAFKLSPRDDRIEVNMGVVMSKLGMNEEAEKHIRNVIDRDRKNSKACNALACHLANHGRFREALTHFTRAIEIEPDNVEYYLNLGLLMEQYGLPEKAAQIYEKVTVVNPSASEIVRSRMNRLGSGV